MDQSNQLKEHEWQCYPKTTDIALAKRLFKEKYGKAPLTTILWGQWLYVGPVPIDKKRKA